MSRGTVAVGLLVAVVALDVRVPAQTPLPASPSDIQSFSIKGSIDFADHRQPRKGVFQIWYQAPDKFVQRERITYVQRDGLDAGQPAEITSTTLGFDGDFVIFDGKWPGPPEFAGRYSAGVSKIPTQADLSDLLPAVHNNCADWLLAFRGSSPDGSPLSDSVRDEVRLWRETRTSRLTPELSSLSGSWIPKKFSDYRTVGALLVPYRAETGYGPQSPANETWRIDEFKLNVAIDRKIFKHK